MIGKIWESAIRKTKKPLNFSGLPGKSAALAGERLRPLGHISAAVNASQPHGLQWFF